MSTKYEQLLERVVVVMEEQRGVADALLKVSESVQKNVADLNGNFVLHIQHSGEVEKAVLEIRKELLKWVKWLGILLLIAVGGATVLRIATSSGLESIFK